MLILPYQPTWPKRFGQIAEVLLATLQGLPVKIHHVGSTSVPGLAAKDIIDIDIAHPEAVTLGEIAERLASIGYQHNGDQGIPLREVFKRKERQENHPVLDRFVHHLYVCPNNSPELKRHLHFRDQLRASLTLREAYASLKESIAQAANQDKKVYASLKEAKARNFIETVLLSEPPPA
ncbi:MAG: GrpB family protein [Bacteroidota bacterium]